MNAMIFAAGLGSRLKPLTDKLPKALVLFQGQPLLYHAINSVVEAGARRVIVNVHHFADQIIDYIKSVDWNAEVIISDERDVLLDTGGGLIKAAPLFLKDQPIILRNADIVTSASLKDIVSFHLERENDVTLMVKERETSRYLVFDDAMNLCAWKNTKTGEEIIIKDCCGSKDYGFCGIHIVDYKMLQLLGNSEKFSIILGYLNAAKRVVVKGWLMAPEEVWFDVGTCEKLEMAENWYKQKLNN